MKKSYVFIYQYTCVFCSNT